MGEIHEIIVERYPVEKLPDELRARLNSAAPLRVTLEQSTDDVRQQTPRPLYKMRGFAQGLYAGEGVDPVDFVRQMRDERN